MYCRRNLLLMEHISVPILASHETGKLNPEADRKKKAQQNMTRYAHDGKHEPSVNDQDRGMQLFED